MPHTRGTRAERAQALSDLKMERKKETPDLAEIRRLCAFVGIHVLEDEPQADAPAESEETSDGERETEAAGSEEPQAGAGPEPGDEESAAAPGDEADSGGGGVEGGGASEPDAAG